MVSEESAVRAVTKAVAHRGFGRAKVYLAGPKPLAPHGPMPSRSTHGGEVARDCDAESSAVLHERLKHAVPGPGIKRCTEYLPHFGAHQEDVVRIAHVNYRAMQVAA